MIHRHADIYYDEDRYYRDTPSLKHNLSFAGCGFLGLYHVGVCACMRKFAPHLYHNKPISGSSAGAIAAACLICDVNIGDSLFHLHSRVQWLYAGKFSRSDGGFSDNLLCINRNTIKVSPFVGEADICPMDSPWDLGYAGQAPQHVEDVLGTIFVLNNNIRLTWTNVKRIVNMVWPMSREELNSLSTQGFKDAMRFLTARGFIACRLHRTPRAFSNVAKSPPLFRLRRQLAMASNRATTAQDTKTAIRRSRSSVTMLPADTSSDHSSDSVRRLVGYGVGLNMAECLACQDELCRAHEADLPTFIRAVILGNDRRRSRRFSLKEPCCYSLSCLRSGSQLFQRLACQTASKVYTFGHWALCSPIFLQLDLLIHIVSLLSGSCGEQTMCYTNLSSLLNALHKLRRHLVSLDSYTRLTDDSPMTSKSGPVRHQPTQIEPNSDNRNQVAQLTDTFQSVLAMGTNSVSEYLFSFSDVKLPTAEECGLELLATAYPDMQSLHFNLSTAQLTPSPSTSNRGVHEPSDEHSRSRPESSTHHNPNPWSSEREDAAQNTSCPSSTSVPLTPCISDVERVNEASQSSCTKLHQRFSTRPHSASRVAFTLPHDDENTSH